MSRRENDENTDSQPDEQTNSKKRPAKRAKVLAERDNQPADDEDDDDVELLPEDDEDSAEMLPCLREKSLKNSDAGIVLSIEAKVSHSSSLLMCCNARTSAAGPAMCVSHLLLPTVISSCSSLTFCVPCYLFHIDVATRHVYRSLQLLSTFNLV